MHNNRLIDRLQAFAALSASPKTPLDHQEGERSLRLHSGAVSGLVADHEPWHFRRRAGRSRMVNANYKIISSAIRP